QQRVSVPVPPTGPTDGPATTFGTGSAHRRRTVAILERQRPTVGRRHERHRHGLILNATSKGSLQMSSSAMEVWQPSRDWLRVQTLDAHCGGEPLRIIVAGLPDVVGEDILARRRFMRDRLDLYRRLVMQEPRGHRDMYGCVIVPPVTSHAHF